MIRGVFLAGALLGAAALGGDELAAPASLSPAPSSVEDFVRQLPEGTLRLVLERMPPADRTAVLAAAAPEIAAIRLRRTRGELGDPAAQQQLELVLTREAARLILMQQSPASAAYEGRLVGGKAIAAAQLSGSYKGKVLADSAIEKLGADVLLGSVYVHSPLNPRDDGEPASLKPNDRLGRLVERRGFKATVGLGKRLPSGAIDLYCSGILISPTVVVTAGHCVKGKLAPATPAEIVVLAHFQGGSASAFRPADNKHFKNISTYAVAAGKAHVDMAPVDGNLVGYDVGVLQLGQSVGMDAFPARAVGLPSPVHLTAAGWGATDAQPLNDVALEITVIRFKPGVPLSLTPPTLAYWKVSQLTGSGRICAGDSGGPIFSGIPDHEGRLSLRLVGIVSGGRKDCTTGEQYVTDLRSSQIRSFICSFAAGSTYCAGP